MFRKKQFEVEISIEATDPAALLDGEHATPKGVWLRLEEPVYGRTYFPLVIVAGDFDAVREFIMLHWGATDVKRDGTVEWENPWDEDYTEHERTLEYKHDEHA